MAVKDNTVFSGDKDPLKPVMEVLRGADAETVCAKYGISRKELDHRFREYQLSRRQMALADGAPFEKVGRNEPCPCGSGKKFKKCCLPRYEESRKSTPPDQLKQMEEKNRVRKTLEREMEKGLDLIFSGEYDKGRRLAERMLGDYPEDDRFHDILVTTYMATGDYDRAFHLCRHRWQVAREEKEFYQEHGYHKREGQNQDKPVYFHSPSTWLEKFWIAQRARAYRDELPPGDNERVIALVEKLKTANDMNKFPARQEEGYEMRRKALAPVLEELEAEGEAAVPYLLPLTYYFSWASLFVPDLLYACAGEPRVRLLAELSMFRIPYFAQKCLDCLERLGGDAVVPIEELLNDHKAFDELKGGLILVLGNVGTPESLAVLKRLTDHENPYILRWVVQALEKSESEETAPYLEKARSRLHSHSKIADVVQELSGQGSA